MSQIAKAELNRLGVKNDLFVEKEEAIPAIAVVQIDKQGERTVMYSMKGYTPFNPEDVDESIFEDCKLLLVDGYDTEINLHLLKLAQKYHVPSVLDMEIAELDIMQEMVNLTSYAILPLEGAKNLCGKENIKECLQTITSQTNAQIIITDGINGSFAMYKDKIIHQKAYKVNVVDTTGCGDAFHAAFASALIQGMDVPACMQYGSLFAAQIAKEFGGRTKFPTREFMSSELKKLQNKTI